MIYGSVCSGIEAASVAWHPLGWKPAFFSEIEAFPRAVLSHHFPEVPLHGDFTTIQAGDYRPIDLLVGGTPCQSFSIAGLRKGLDDDRGNLALEYLRLADRLRPQWLVWENVPGVLSSNGGRDFGAFLGGLVELGYGFAYRVLDAQFFGVAQRRRRVFVVGYAGDWRPAAAVLFERHSLSGHPAPSRAAGQGPAGTIGASSGDWSRDNIGEALVPFDTTQITSAANFSHPRPGDPCHPLTSGGHPPSIASTLCVRRLIPTECERLQGFPDGWTQVPYREKPASDGPRYKALGNSMAVPVMAWIGRRIAEVNSIISLKEAA